MHIEDITWYTCLYLQSIHYMYPHGGVPLYDKSIDFDYALPMPSICISCPLFMVLDRRYVCLCVCVCSCRMKTANYSAFLVLFSFTIGLAYHHHVVWLCAIQQRMAKRNGNNAVGCGRQDNSRADSRMWPYNNDVCTIIHTRRGARYDRTISSVYLLCSICSIRIRVYCVCATLMDDITASCVLLCGC